ncbi:MAG: hypothetical protein EHM53_10830 [Methanoregulaceae archaeon]|nr:MAG: hypothetical protein EHM53_10830 [Methanoregulaceae archaeon]
MKKRRDQFEDTDGDGPDSVERAMGIHDSDNKHVRHFNIGGSLKTGSNGTIGIFHQNLKSSIGSSGKMSLKINEPRAIKMSLPDKGKTKLSVNMKNPSIKGFDIRKISIPESKLNDKRIKTPISSFSEDYINAHLDRILKKYKKKRK